MISRYRLLTIPVVLAFACMCAACAGVDTPIPSATPAATVAVRITDTIAPATHSPTARSTLVSETPEPTATIVPPTPTQAATATATATELPIGGTVRYGLVAPALNLDPVHAKATTDRHIVGLIWESLLRVDPADGRLLAGLAEGWSVSGDGDMLRFSLTPNAQWHDGKPVTAEDVVYTLEYLTMAGSYSPWQINLAAVESVTASGDHDVEIVLSQPACAALYDIGLIPILPAHQLNALESSTLGTTLAGSGPFRLSEPVSEGEYLLVQNADYREPVTLDELIIAPYASSDVLYSAWEASAVDMAHFPVDQIVSVNSDSAHTLPGDDHFLLIFNLRRSALMNEDVRQALTLGLDRESIANQVSPAGATVLQTSLLPDHWALSATDLPAPAHDPATAARLLTEAGWADEDGDGWRNKWDTLLSLDVLTNGENPLRMSTASLVSQSFRRLGVESELHIVEWGIFLDLLFRHDFDVAVISWPFPLDPDQSDFWHSSEVEAGRGFNFGQWVNEDVDALLDEAATYPGCDLQGRSALYGQFAGLMTQEYSIVPLFVPHEQLLVRETVYGVHPGAFAGPLWNAHTWASTVKE